MTVPGQQFSIETVQVSPLTLKASITFDAGYTCIVVEFDEVLEPVKIDLTALPVKVRECVNKGLDRVLEQIVMNALTGEQKTAHT